MNDGIAAPGGFSSVAAGSQQGRNPPLDRLVRRERVAEILGTLTAAELVVALLRAEGMSDAEIGEFLAIERWVVRQRMIRARARIAQIGPGTARMLEGRRR